jgi:hypothetical protein
MAKNLVSRNVQAGDPITADIFNNFYTDLNTLATPETVSNVVIKNANESAVATKITNTVWNSGIKSVNVGAGAPVLKTFQFGSKIKWAEAPLVWVQVYTEGTTLLPFSQSQVFPQVQSVTTTEAKIYFRCAVASPNLKVIIFATGTPA